MPRPVFPAWKRTPFLRIFIPFAIGICLEYYFSLSRFHFVLAGICTIILLSCFFYPVYLLHRYRLMIGACIHLLLFSCGAICFFIHDEKNNPHNLVNQESNNIKIQYYIASITQDFSKRITSFRTEAQVLFTGNGSKINPCTGKILLYFPSFDSLGLPPIGSIIRINKSPTRIPSNANPGSFDFALYSARNNIFHQDFISASNYSIIGKRKTGFYSRFMLALQNHILFVLRKYIAKDKAGLAEALLIGYKEDLEQGLLDSYSKTGVIHVIAISGLHLALVYLLLEKTIGRLLQLVQLLRRKKFNHRAVQALIVITGLWIFTMLAGATPSVVRSAVMFTVIALGSALNKRPNIINSLAASAFLLLCYHPAWLWDIGFQLSYSAVLSLVIFAKPVYDLFYISNRLLDQLWKMSSVTLAAQLCTLPLILFHFHQFPVYFLPANLICVPLSSAILLAEILLFISDFLPVIANGTGWLIGWGIHLMNASVAYFSSMPFSNMGGIFFDPLQTLVLFISIGLLAAFIKQKKPKLFLSTLFMLFLVPAIGIIHDEIARRQQKLVIYHQNGSRAIQLVNGRRAILIADTSRMISSRTLQSAALYFNLKKENKEAILYPAGNQLLKFKGRIILMINKKQLPRITHADIIVISSSVKVDLGGLNEKFHPSVIIMDGSNRRKILEGWKSDCERLSLPCHITAERGAFVMNLNSSNFAASHKDFDQ